ncbi:hypothetical protein Mhun_0345 [Methanospirillum hungatei JF-1]|uniref:Uncharacterized protein n=1 Tax=Methanospirillum hungatei JF-1 (strain ATCC 27890 / DSM 864 / NBRC 100397 / JF-1) TaxID=323259 RepID=Q2FN34_METHJ|nr:hypothetical protein Mhun_0345 [Methanospirillum hungatei JF-1]
MRATSLHPGNSHHLTPFNSLIGVVHLSSRIASGSWAPLSENSYILSFYHLVGWFFILRHPVGTIAKPHSVILYGVFQVFGFSHLFTL